MNICFSMMVKWRTRLPIAANTKKREQANFYFMVKQLIFNSMKLISTQPQPGALNVPIFWTMTNKMVSDAISEEIRLQKVVLSESQRRNVDNALTSLKSTPQEIYFDYPDNCEDCFCLSYKI
jgi:hypothetical protein